MSAGIDCMKSGSIWNNERKASRMAEGPQEPSVGVLWVQKCVYMAPSERGDSADDEVDGESGGASEDCLRLRTGCAGESAEEEGEV